MNGGQQTVKHDALPKRALALPRFAHYPDQSVQDKQKEVMFKSFALPCYRTFCTLAPGAHIALTGRTHELPNTSGAASRCPSPPPGGIQDHIDINDSGEPSEESEPECYALLFQVGDRSAIPGYR